MTKLLDGVSFNRQIQRVVETKKGLIINGSYYRKNTMTPVPFSFFPTYGSYLDMATSRRFLVNSGISVNTKNRGNLLTTDINDSEIQYLFLYSPRTENYQNILKIKENDDGCKLINNVVINARPRDNSLVFQIVGQDVNYVYVLFDSNGLCKTLSRINKNTLSLESIKGFTQYAYTQGIYEDENYIYLASSIKGKNSILKYNKVANTMTEYTSPLNEEVNNDISFEFTEPIKVDNHLIFYGLKLALIDTNKAIRMVKIDIDLQIDTLADAITESIVNTVYNEEVPELPVLTGYTNYYEPFILSIEGTRYLNIAVHDVSTSTIANYPKYGIYTFKINEDNMEFKSFLNLGNVPFRGFLSINDNKNLVCITDQSIFFTNFTLASESYIINDNKIVNPKAVGIDMDENIWYINGNSTVDLMNLTSADSVEITSEKTDYIYNGENISTFINVSAKNINGELIATRLSLIIKGDAIWDSNNSKNINITTSSEDITKIPITIKNNGNISIIPRFIM